MNTENITKNILNKYCITANKRLGQNFLINDTILQKITEVANVTNEDLVIEIGPGIGNLTEYLIKKAKYVLAFEIDNKMIEILNNRFKDLKNLCIVHEDILKVDINKEIEKVVGKFNKIKVVANLPYYITTPILFKLLNDTNNISEIFVMVQKEVAQRITANTKNKNYGVLSLMCQYLSISKICFYVENNNFIPCPKVDSAIVSFEKVKRYDIKDEKIFLELIHKSFMQRRKKLINSLVLNDFLNEKKEFIESLLKDCNISENIRAEELSIDQYVAISNYIASKYKKSSI